MDILSDAFINETRHTLAPWGYKSKLFSLHRDAFPEITDKAEITERFRRYAKVTTLMNLPYDTAKRIEQSLLKTLEKRTDPCINDSCPF